MFCENKYIANSVDLNFVELTNSHCFTQMRIYHINRTFFSAQNGFELMNFHRWNNTRNIYSKNKSINYFSKHQNAKSQHCGLRDMNTGADTDTETSVEERIPREFINQTYTELSGTLWISIDFSRRRNKNWDPTSRYNSNVTEYGYWSIFDSNQ